MTSSTIDVVHLKTITCHASVALNQTLYFVLQQPKDYRQTISNHCPLTAQQLSVFQEKIENTGENEHSSKSGILSLSHVPSHPVTPES